MKKIKFLYFDLGGVVIDHVFGLTKTAKILDLDSKEVITFFQTHADDLDRGTLSVAELEDIFESKFGIKEKTDEKIGEIIVDNFRAIRETHDFINQIANDFKIGILSNISVDVFNLIKNKELIPDINYDSIVLSAELGRIKPEKEIFDFALSKTQFHPAEILFIDDRNDNIEAAKSFDWNGILFDTKDPKKSIELIQKRILLGN